MAAANRFSGKPRARDNAPLSKNVFARAKRGVRPVTTDAA